MNAAGRLVHQGTLYRHLVLTHLLTRRQLAIVVLASAIILSLLSTIYVTHVTREMHANVQRQLQEMEHLSVLRGQLLLERSTWMMQARIQQIAEKKLGMIMPNQQSVVIVRE